MVLHRQCGRTPSAFANYHVLRSDPFSHHRRRHPPHRRYLPFRVISLPGGVSSGLRRRRRRRRRRVSSVRASLANGRRASRASYAAGSRRVSQLARSRVSVATANAAASGTGAGGAEAGEGPAGGAEGGTGAGVEVASSGGSGMGSRRESAMILVRGSVCFVSSC